MKAITIICAILLFSQVISVERMTIFEYSDNACGTKPKHTTIFEENVCTEQKGEEQKDHYKIKAEDESKLTAWFKCTEKDCTNCGQSDYKGFNG